MYNLISVQFDLYLIRNTLSLSLGWVQPQCVLGKSYADAPPVKQAISLLLQNNDIMVKRWWCCTSLSSCCVAVVSSVSSNSDFRASSSSPRSLLLFSALFRAARSESRSSCRSEMMPSSSRIFFNALFFCAVSSSSLQIHTIILELETSSPHLSFSNHHLILYKDNIWARLELRVKVCSEPCVCVILLWHCNLGNRE